MKGISKTSRDLEKELAKDTAKISSKDCSHEWVMIAAAEMPDPTERQILIAIWECSECHDTKSTWGLKA